MSATRTLIELAIQRANHPILGAALADLLSNLITPVDDPIYDWQIVKATEVGSSFQTPDGATWRVGLPDVIACRNWVAPTKQCAVAWGTRLSPTSGTPNPTAVLTWVTRDQTGTIRAVPGIWVRYAPERGTWFVPQDQTNDQAVRTALEMFMSQRATAGTATADQNTTTLQGVDLDDDETEDETES